MSSLSMARGFAAGLVAATVAAAAPAAAAPCKGRNVVIRKKTPVRRGPGLNYAVASFLDKTTCAPFSEVSIDEQWVLVEVDRGFGWVPIKRLSKPSQKRLARVGNTSGPVGSGQRRNLAQVLRQSVLLERPGSGGAVRRILPENVRLLPLAVTRDGTWVQARDERGDVGWVARRDLVGDGFSRLPRVDIVPIEQATAGVDGAAFGRTDDDDFKATVETKAEPPPPLAGFRIAMYGAALNPVHSLDSNGIEPIRRYDLSALSAGVALEAEAPPLGPISTRLGYTLAFLNSLTTDDIQNTGGAGGLQHEAYLRFGWPLTVGGVRLTPELGYHFGWFDFDAFLAGQIRTVFLSTQTHAGTVGLRAQYVLFKDFTLDADAGGVVGVTQVSPEGLGDAGLTFGFGGQLGLRWAFAGNFSAIVRYAAQYRTTGFTGQAELDPTITEATLVDVVHGMMAGVAIDL